MTAALIALLLEACGVAAICGAWRGALAPKGLALAGGWAAVAAAVVFWCRSAGIEFGIVYAALATTALAWIAVLVNYETRARKHLRQESGQAIVPDSATLARHCGRFVVAVPVAALAAGFTGALAVSWLPLGAIDAMALAVLTIPLIWGLASYWACADSRLMRPALGLTIAGLASGAALFAG